MCSRPAGAGGSDEYSEGEGEERGLSARRGSLQPEPHDARRRQPEQREQREQGSGRRALGVGAARSAPRSPCTPRDAAPPRQPRQAPPCGRRRRRRGRCHVPGEARGGRSGDEADRLAKKEAEAAAGGGDKGARARAHGGARFARPGHVPGRAGHEAGGAGGAAAPALAGAALGAAAAAAAASPGPGKPPGGPACGGRRTGTALASPAPAWVFPSWGIWGKVARGPDPWSPLLWAGLWGPCWPRTPATKPLPQLAGTRGRVGSEAAGCP